MKGSMIFAAAYAIAVGILMIVQWTLVISQRRIPDPGVALSGRGRLGMAFHWVAESVTSIALVAAGIALLFRQDWAPRFYLLAVGMLIYTVINSTGYFAQRREWPMVGIFGALLTVRDRRAHPHFLVVSLPRAACHRGVGPTVSAEPG